jgi:hypothetical protein
MTDIALFDSARVIALDFIETIRATMFFEN